MKTADRVKRSLCAWLSIILIVSLLPYQAEHVQAAVLQSSVIKSYAESKEGQSYPDRMCLQFVEECYQALGAARPYNCCASKSGNNYIRSTSSADIPVGATVYFGNCGGGPCRTCGSSYFGHAGIYVGNGYFIHASGGRVQKSSISSWANKYRGYGYCGNFSLAGGTVSDNCSCSAAYAGDYTVTANGALNMRNGHGTNFGTVASIPTGTVVRVTKSDGQWAHVEWNGRSGYCSMQYLSKVNPVGAPQIQTWISDTKMGNKSSSFKKGNWYYLCYQLVDLKSGKRYSEAGGQADYSVTETLYHPDGSIAITQNYGKSDYNWIAVRADSAGTYKGVIKVTGDFEGDSTVSFEIVQNVRPGIRVWFSDSRMGNGQTSGTKGKTYYLCYELLDLNTNKRLNESSPGNYKVTETIFQPGGSRLFTYAYDQSDYNWIRSAFDGTGIYRGTVQATVNGKTVQESAQITISEPVNIRQDLYYGDLDGDRRVTATDLSVINRAANGKITLTPDEKKRADVNGDGYVNKEDVELIQQFIVGLIREFPAEKQLASISITRKPSKMVYTIGEKLITDGMTVTANYNNGKSRTVTGYKVTGNTNSAGVQKVQVSYTEAGITKTASYDIQVNKRQEKIVSLTYDANGGSGGPGIQTAEAGSAVRISYSVPVKSYTVVLNAGSGTVNTGRIQLKAQFIGWTSNRNGISRVYQPGASIALSADKTLYASYESVRLGNLPVPVRDGYTFTGWYYGSSKVSANTKISADCQLTAKWDKNAHIHTPGNWTTISEATTALYGRKVKKCTVCGTIIEEKIIPMLEPAADDKPDTDDVHNSADTNIRPDPDKEIPQNPDSGKDQTQQPDTGNQSVSSEENEGTGLENGELEEIKDSNLEPSDTLPDYNLPDRNDSDENLSDQDAQNKPLEDDNQNNYEQTGTDQTGVTDPDKIVTDDGGTQQEDGQKSDDSDTDSRTDDFFYEDTDNDDDGGYEDEEQDEECAVEWNVKSAVLQKGKITSAVKAYVTGDDEIVRYQTSNSSVVAVNTSGKMKGIKTGKALVRVVTKRGNTAIVQIKVQKKAVKTKKITVNKKNVRLKAGKKFRLETEITPVTSSQKIRYLSSNSKIAAVDKKGLIKAKKKGTAVIKVKSGKKTVKVKVVVR